MANESIDVVESGVGTPFATAASYVATDWTWYRFQIVRAGGGVTTVSIKGGAFGTESWTEIVESSGSNPFTDNTTTTSAYMTIFMPTGSRIANIRIY